MSYFEILYKKYDKLTLTIQEVAQELGVQQHTIYRMLEAGELNVGYIKRGTKKLFLTKSLAEYLQAHDELVA